VKVGNIEHGVVCGYDSADGVVAHKVSATHIVCRGDNLRDGIAERVGDEELTTVWLEGELQRGSAYIHQGFEAVGLVWIGFGVG
jgi:hypothetical protein